jgi:pilus assembly protein CpaB
MVAGTPQPAAAAGASQAAPAVRVLVAKKELATGAFLKAGDLEWQAWPERGLIEDYVREDPQALAGFEGAVVRTRLHRGEPITRTRVIHPGDKGFLAAVLDPGKRAVAVPIDGVTGVGGFVMPGDAVDVILTIEREQADDTGRNPEKRHFAETLLRRVRVLAIDQTADKAAGEAKLAKTVTLEVTPKQAERLALGQSLGALGLSLRSLQAAAADPAAPAVAHSANPADADADASYTRDTDVLSMMGDPWGLAPPAGVRRKLSVLRGSAAEDIRY